MDLWILQARPTNQLEPYELTRLREEARELGIRVEAVAPQEIDLIVSRGGRRSIRRCGIEVDLPDALLPRTGSATDYFSLAILRQLEQLGVTTINTSRSIEAVKDKLYAHQILTQKNLPIPRTMLARFPVDVQLVVDQIGFPCVVKLLTGSYGEGVVLCSDPRSFRDLMELISSMDRSRTLILQQYIGSRPGEDLRVWVVGDRVLGAMLRRSTDGSFKANISRGGDGRAYALNPEIEALALASANALNLEVAGVDLLFDDNTYCVCEVNSAPGFEGFEAATGLNVARSLLQLCRDRSCCAEAIHGQAAGRAAAATVVAATA
jgi:gamma-F420-2:alpha-L-glutamate ligase